MSLLAVAQIAAVKWKGLEQAAIRYSGNGKIRYNYIMLSK